MTIYDVAVIGEIYVDHVFTGFAQWPQPGEEVFTTEYVQELGGGAAITACALGQLGRSVKLVGLVGRHELPWIAQRLAQFGVESTGLLSSETGTGVTVSISSRVERSFFTYVGVNAQLRDPLVATAILESVSQARHVHLAFPIEHGLAGKLLQRAQQAGCTTSLDVGHQPQWLLKAENQAICARIDYLLPNEREARILAAGDAYDYLHFTQSRNWPSGVVKMGAQGALMRDRTGTVRVPACDVETIDTTGAGDAFDAGFIDGLLDGESSAECLRRGCICGSLSTRAAGALNGIPDRQDFARCYEETYG
ncbi:MAG: carbohydrate kinase family protein [Acidobacteriota bacterium]